MHDIAVPDVDLELAITRRLLERLPKDRLDWRPHEKSWTLGELATHMASLLGWHRGILGQASFNLSEVGPPLDAAESREEILALFDRQAEEFQAALREASAEDLRAEWTIRNGEKVINRQPRVAALRTTCISHLIHHRGQLTVYLRLLNVPLPPVYGQTADEAAPWGA